VRTNAVVLFFFSTSLLGSVRDRSCDTRASPPGASGTPGDGVGRALGPCAWKKTFPPFWPFPNLVDCQPRLLAEWAGGRSFVRSEGPSPKSNRAWGSGPPGK